MKLFRVYYSDGNQQVFEGLNIATVIDCIVYGLKQYRASEITKVEQIESI